MIGDNVLGEERMNPLFLCINAGKKALSLNGRTGGQSLLRSCSGGCRGHFRDQPATPELRLRIDYDSLSR
jgi:hypothetical protein